MAVMKVPAKDFDEAIKEGVWIADFYTDHCGPCKVLDVVVDQVIFDNPMVNLMKCNIDDDPEYADRFEIMGTPTLIFFNDGAEVDRFEGACARERIEESISKCLYE